MILLNQTDIRGTEHQHVSNYYTESYLTSGLASLCFSLV